MPARLICSAKVECPKALTTKNRIRSAPKRSRAAVMKGLRVGTRFKRARTSWWTCQESISFTRLLSHAFGSRVTDMPLEIVFWNGCAISVSADAATKPSNLEIATATFWPGFRFGDSERTSERFTNTSNGLVPGSGREINPSRTAAIFGSCSGSNR